jgi:hypothetical protein
VLGKAFETINFSKQGWEMLAFRQALARSYAQGPDIYFAMVEGIRTGEGSVLPGLKVRRVYTSGASGGTEILRPLAQYHHDNWIQPGGGPILDNYFILVGQIPEHRPTGAAVVVFQTEAEALTAIENGWDIPEDTDEPKFRYYEVPGTGHMFPFRRRPRTRVRSPTSCPKVFRGSPRALWDAPYQWVDGGAPMPRPPPDYERFSLAGRRWSRRVRQRHGWLAHPTG